MDIGSFLCLTSLVFELALVPQLPLLELGAVPDKAATSPILHTQTTAVG